MEERESGADRFVDRGRDDPRLSRSGAAMPVRDASIPDDGAVFHQQMEIGRRAMRKHRNVLAALAK